MHRLQHLRLHNTALWAILELAMISLYNTGLAAFWEAKKVALQRQCFLA